MLDGITFDVMIFYGLFLRLAIEMFNMP